MRIATWNVNSLKIRLEQVLQLLHEQQLDVLALQELKLTDDAFPHQALAEAGYQAVVAGQKTYNGVALVYRHGPDHAIAGPASDISINLQHYPDEQKRLISASFPVRHGEKLMPWRIISSYWVNGASIDSDKFQYKLQWIDALLKEAPSWLQQHEHVALLGDFNIAPTDLDVYDPVAFHDSVLCTPAERQRFQALAAMGWMDQYRVLHPEARDYTWWDYRQLGFQKNRGLRIDHILLSPALSALCQSISIDRASRKKPQPSDHAPVIASFGVAAG